MSDSDLDEMGPVDYLVVEFPAGQANFSGEMAAELCGRMPALANRAMRRQASLTASNATGPNWSMASRAPSFLEPTTPSNWSSDVLTSIIKTSAVSRISNRPTSIWLFLRNSIVSLPSRTTPSPLFGASVPFSWPVMTSARCR